MRDKIWLWIARLWRRPGIRISSFGAAALLVALMAPLVDGLIPQALVDRFSREAVLPILNILASSMLAVTTFSLGNMVQAFRSAAGQATPRVYQLLMQDMTTLNVLSVFVGAFLFSLMSIVMFRAGFYSESAAVIIFGLTMICIVLIVIAILRWIAHLSQLGSLHHTLSMVENSAKPPLDRLAKMPNHGAHAASSSRKAPKGSTALRSPRTGFVQHISLAGLDEHLAQSGATLWIATPPASWVLKDTPLAYVEGDSDPDKLLENFTIGDERTLEQDARFGLVIMSEIASRALSSGVNDPGTAIDVIHRTERILWTLGEQMMDDAQDTEIHYDHIIIGTVSADDLLGDAYAAIMADGGDRFDVMTAILLALNDLSQSEWPDLARSAKDMRAKALSIIARRVEDPEAVQKLREIANPT